MATKAKPTESPAAVLEALKGSVPLAQLPRIYNLPKSSVYRDARTGLLKTFRTAGGLTMVTPQAALEYLQGAGDPPKRGRQFTKEDRP